MKIKGVLLSLMMSSVLLTNCGKDDVSLNSEVNDFVWLAMNQFYYWQSDVPELADGVTRNSLNSFLNGYASPEALFKDLLFEQDRFSWIVDDYEELEASFQGVTTSFGYEFRLINPTGTDDIYGYVKYVVPPSVQSPVVPAYDAGLKRGDLFTEVDGMPLNLSNYVSLLFEQSSYTLTLGEVVDGNVTSTDQTISMTSIELTENPIHHSTVIDQSGIKVGYLAYNQFINNDNYHLQLNNVFGEFIAQGVTELVLDLRYNPGGSLTTSRILASMMVGSATSSTVFGSIVYNEKLVDFNTDLTFYDEIPGVSEPINSLNLNRVFILTSNNTASASELIIAGMLPFMDVTIIGTSTVGKNVGSVTLYDSPNYLRTPENSSVNHTNPNHRYAIQPIISQLANSDGFTDYIDGFEADIEINEVDLIGQIQPLGDPEEHFLAEALSIISGAARTERVSPRYDLRSVYDSHERKKHLETIKIDQKEIPVILNFQ